MNSLPSIPRPLSQRWRDFRFQGLPVLVFLAVGGAILLLWDQSWTSGTFVGEVQSVEAVVSSTQAGTLVDLHVDDFESVTRNQVLAKVLVKSPETATAEIAAMKSDLEVMRVRMGQDQQRNDLNYQGTRVDLQLRKLELASARIRFQQAESELERLTRLYQDKILPKGITQLRNEFGYEVALRDRDLFREEVEQKTRLVTDLEQTLERFQTTNGPGRNSAVNAAIDAAIGAQEKLLEETVGSVSLRAPIDGVVKKVLRHPGENIAAGEPLIELGNGQPERIVGFLRQPITARPQVGDLVEVRKRGSKLQVGLAKVVRVGAQLQLFTQPLRVRGFAASMERGLPVLLTVPEGMDLYPGEAVDLVPKWSQ